MAIYSIKDLEKLSGIKAHTIRIWEQRYCLISPKRTATNIRYYEDEDLKLLLSIALLNRNGVKISKIVGMKSADILSQVAALSELSFDNGAELDALTLSMLEMDEYKFDRIISTNIQQLGFERAMLDVIYPFLEKLSVLWLTGSIVPVQEHFISNLIRQKLVVAIDKEPMSNVRGAKKFLIFLPEGETQELTMLFVHYLLKSRGHQVLYVGQNIQLDDLKDAARICAPDFVFTMITETFSRQPVQQYVDMLSAVLPDSSILLSGYQVVFQNVLSRQNITVLQSLEHTIQFLNALSGVRSSQH